MPTPPDVPADLDELLALAVSVATEASDLLLTGRSRALATVDTKSTSTDMVSELDRASEQLIVEALTTARPGDGIIGEEGADRPSTSGITWVVDPLDGTTNYLYGIPGWNVSIAAVCDGVGVVGVVADPARGETFTARRGGGAHCNGATLVIAAPPQLERALVGTGFGYDPARRRHQADVLGRVIGTVRDIRRGGAAAVDLCWVANGRLDAHYERGLSPWDHAAGAVVAGEAGAAVIGADDAGPDERLVVAAAPGLAEQLRDLVVGAGALDGP